MRVFSNTAISVGGKISTHLNERIGLGSAEDLRRMSLLRATADALIVGGRTFRNWPIPHIENPAHFDTPPKRKSKLINAVLTRRGLSEANPKRWPHPDVDLMVFGPETLESQTHQDRFGAELIHTKEPSIEWVLDVLENRGCQTVIIEGGGDIIFQAIESNRLDEMFITICPTIIGGKSSPSIISGLGFPADKMRKLTLVSSEPIGDEIFLHYRIQ